MVALEHNAAEASGSQVHCLPHTFERKSVCTCLDLNSQDVAVLANALDTPAVHGLACSTLAVCLLARLTS